MSTRTPSVQSRNAFQRDWGNYSTATGLPNASGNALANPEFSKLEAGDTAYVSGVTSPFICVTTGTVSGGNATWTLVGQTGSVASSSASFTLSTTVSVYLINTTSGAINVTLPNPVGSAGKIWLLKKTNTGLNGITLVRFAAESIEGVAASFLLPGSNTVLLGAWTLVCDGTNWWVL